MYLFYVFTFQQLLKMSPMQGALNNYIYSSFLYFMQQMHVQVSWGMHIKGPTEILCQIPMDWSRFLAIFIGVCLHWSSSQKGCKSLTRSHTVTCVLCWDLNTKVLKSQSCYSCHLPALAWSEWHVKSKNTIATQMRLSWCSLLLPHTRRFMPQFF